MRGGRFQMKSFRKSSLAVLLSLVGPAAFAQTAARVAPSAPAVVPGATAGSAPSISAPVVPGISRPGSTSGTSSSRSQFSRGQVQAVQQANPSSSTQGAAAPAVPALTAPRAAAPAQPVRNPVRRRGQSAAVVADPVAARMSARLLDGIRSYYGAEVANDVAPLDNNLREVVTVQLSAIQASPADESLEKEAGAAVANIAKKAGVSPFGLGMGQRECFETFGKPAVTSALTTVVAANRAVGADLDSSNASLVRLDGALTAGLGEATGRTGEALNQAAAELKDPNICGILKAETASN